MFTHAGYSNSAPGFSLWATLMEFVEAMWLTGHEEED
jgi:hypothetical protein